MLVLIAKVVHYLSIKYNGVIKMTRPRPPRLTEYQTIAAKEIRDAARNDLSNRFNQLKPGAVGLTVHNKEVRR